MQLLAGFGQVLRELWTQIRVALRLHFSAQSGKQTAKFAPKVNRAQILISAQELLVVNECESTLAAATRQFRRRDLAAPDSPALRSAASNGKGAELSSERKTRN